MRRCGISINSDLFYGKWDGVEKKIFNYLMFFTTDSEFEIVEQSTRDEPIPTYFRFTNDARRNTVAVIESKLSTMLVRAWSGDHKTRNKLSCRFFAEQPFFSILPDNIKNYVIANSI